MRKMMFILVMACCSSTAIAGAWGNEANLTAHIAYTDARQGSARMMVDFAFGNQCNPEVIVRMDASVLNASDESLILQVDQRKQYSSTVLSHVDGQLLVSFTEDTDKILQDLKAGNKAGVSAKGQTVRFSLSGSSAALAYAQRRCESLQ